MAVTRTAKGTAQSKTAGTTLTLAAVSMSANSLIVVALAYDDVTLTSVTWGAQQLTLGDAVLGAGVRTRYAWGWVTSAVSQTVTATWASSITAKAFTVTQFQSNVSGHTATVGEVASLTGLGTAASTGNLTTAASGDQILFGVVGTEGPSGDTAGTWVRPTTAGQRIGTTGNPASSNVTVSDAYTLAPGVVTNGLSKTGMTSRDWGAVYVNFKWGLPITTVSGSLTADAILRATTLATITADAILLATQAATFTSDAVLAALGGGGGTITHTEYYAETDAATVTNPTLVIPDVTWGDNERVIVVIHGKDDDAAISSITATGLTFTQVYVADDEPSDQIYAYVWKSDLASSGDTQDITINVLEDTHSGGLQASAIVLHGANPDIHAFGAASNEGVDGTAASVDVVTSVAVSRLFFFFNHRSRTFTEDSGDSLTPIRENDFVGTGGGVSSMSSYYRDVTSAGTYNASGTLSTLDDWIGHGFAVVADDDGIDTVSGSFTADAVLASAGGGGGGEPPTRVQLIGTLSSEANTSHAVPISVAPTVGNHALAWFVMGGNRTITAISDTAGNTWTVRVTRNSSTQLTLILAEAYIANALTTSDTVNITVSGSQSVGARIYEYENGDPAGWWDTSATWDNAGVAGTTFDTGPTAAAAVTNSLFVAGLATVSTAGTITVNETLTFITTFGSPTTIRNAYIYDEPQDPAGAAEFSGSHTTSRANAAIVAVLKGAAGGGPATVTGSATADAVLRATVPASFTANAVLRSTVAATFTADSILRRVDNASTFTANAYLLAIVSGTFTANAVLKATIAATFTGNAVLRRVEGGTFSGDAILRKVDNASTLTANAILRKLDNAGTFTANAYLLKIVTASFTADAFFRALVGGTFTADAILRKLDNASTFTANASLRTITSATFTANAVLVQNVTGQFTANAVTRRIESGTFTSDAILRRSEAFSITADAILRKIVSGTFTADAYYVLRTNATFTANATLRTIVPATLTADGIIRRVESATFTANAVLTSGAQATFTANAVLRSTIAGTITADAVLRKEVSGTFPANAIVRRIESGTLTGDAIVRRVETGSFTGNAIVRRIETASFTADAYLLAVRTASFTSDAILRRTEASSFNANAILFRVTSASFTADAYIVNPVAGQGNFSADAVLKKTTASTFTADAALILRTNGSFNANAVLRTVGLGTLTADAIFRKVSESNFAANAVLRGTTAGVINANATLRRVESFSYTANAILRATIPSTFVADAVLKRTQTSTFTADAELFVPAVGQNGSFTANAVLKGAASGSFTADAVIRQSIAYAFTADAFLLAIRQASFTADAYLIGVGLFSFTADAVIRKTSPASFTADAVIAGAYTGPIEVAATVEESLDIVTSAVRGETMEVSDGLEPTIDIITSYEDSIVILGDVTAEV